MPGATWSIEIVDEPGYGEPGISLALDNLGRPRIAYLDVYDSNLKYATTGGGPLTHQVFLPLVRRQ